MIRRNAQSTCQLGSILVWVTPIEDGCRREHCLPRKSCTHRQLAPLLAINCCVGKGREIGIRSIVPRHARIGVHIFSSSLPYIVISFGPMQPKAIFAKTARQILAVLFRMALIKAAEAHLRQQSHKHHQIARSGTTQYRGDIECVIEARSIVPLHARTGIAVKGKGHSFSITSPHT